MDRTLITFVRALRNAEVRVSPAETLDALLATHLVGSGDRATLKNALWLTLPKTPEEKQRFAHCFDRFFDHAALSCTHDADDDVVPGDEQMPDVQETPEPGQVTAQSELGRMLQSGDASGLSLAMTKAGQATEVSGIALFTQKGLYARRMLEHMGLDALNAEISSLAAGKAHADVELGQVLVSARERLASQVRDYVEREFLLHADHDGHRLREELLCRVKLSNLDRRNFRHLEAIVMRMARRLETMAARKRKVFRRGHLHVPRTLRNNMSHDGTLFDLRWKARKISRSRIYAVCDLSGSVANYARFMLLFLYSLESVVPRVRAFAFSSRLGEVTGWFEKYDLEQAIERSMRVYGGGSTDYGQALVDFHALCGDEIDHRATIIMLGDARNNYGDPRQDLMQTLYERAGRIIWLNPEPRGSWTLGDAEMRSYLPCCHQVRVCNSLEHLERLMSDLVRMAR